MELGRSGDWLCFPDPPRISGIERMRATLRAAFATSAGSKPRAPQWMQSARLEWLHRLAREARAVVETLFS